MTDVTNLTATLAALADRIVAHPWRAVTVCFAFGAAFAVGAHRRHPIRSALIDAAGVLAVRIMRDVIARRALEVARSWTDDVSRSHAPREAVGPA